MSVLEVGIPSGYIVHNNTLQAYVRSKKKVNSTLKNAEFYESKAVFYYDYVSLLALYLHANDFYLNLFFIFV